MSGTPPKDRKPVYPPVFFLIALLTMVGVHFLFPWRDLGLGILRVVGLIPIAAGVALAIWGSSLFTRAGTTIKPFETSSSLVISGPFRYSRNPMYLGMVLVLAGVGVLLGSAAPFAVVPLFALLIDRRFIRREEADLEAVFGEGYRNYRARVRRWL